IYISPLTQINLDSHNRIPTTDTRLIRRIVRDYRSRAHTAAMTIHRWPQVRAGENQNIFPYSNEADVFFNTVHVYEMAVLKKYVVPLLQDVKAEEEEYAEAQRLLRLFHYVDDLEDESIIAGDSILREFIGGSIYAD
ncbi:MAG: nucleoside kinase, partial [Eubacteriales bacterium]|nr:nucleoside kinase [Eubacteriales bacterium]